MRNAWRISLVLVLATTASACSSGSDLSTAVTDTADDYLRPAYEQSNVAIIDLAAAVHGACGSMDDVALGAAKEAWHSAKAAWKFTEAAWFGPTTMGRADSNIGYEPTSESGIEETLASDHVLDADFVRGSLPTTQKGIGAIEYILFSGIPLDARRCEYVESVATVLEEDSAALTDAWFVTHAGGSAYIDQFVGTGDMAMKPNDSLGKVVGSVIELTKKLTQTQIGKALGITSPTPLPNAYPEGAAAFGLAALRNQIDGLVATYGSAPQGMSGAIRSRDADVDAAILAALSEAVALTDDLLERTGGTSFAVALETYPDELHALYDVLAVVRRTFETDVVSLLDITLGLSDSDGDSG